jgi:hypothetical protein
MRCRVILRAATVRAAFIVAVALVAMADTKPAHAANPLDPIIAAEQKKASEQNKATSQLTPMPVVSDAVFLRRIYVDLIGRIPTAAEVTKFASQPAATRRAALVDQLLKDERFADRWTLFFADMLRLRTQATGGAALFAWVHQAVHTGMPYDEMCRKLIATNGKAGRVPESGFVLGDNADPFAMASITSQVFLGVRMGCAQCHDHPFDKWKRRDFYDLAAYYGKTRRFESQFTNVVIATEDQRSTITWPPDDEAPPEQRKVIDPRFPFALDGIRGNTEYLKRLQKSREAKTLASKPSASGPSLDDLLEASSATIAKRTSGSFGLDMATAEAKKDIRSIDIQKGLYQPSELREQLAEKVTDPKNGLFPRALVNRVWKTLIGRGFVEPVDDFREDNPAALAPALDFLAEEFVASDYDLRALVRLIVTSNAYQRAHAPGDLDEPTRLRMEEHLFATPVRRMIAESLYDSIVMAGHLFEPKHSPGRNERTIYETVRVPKAGARPAAAPAGDQASSSSGASATNMSAANMIAATSMPAGGYGLETSIELDFNSLLKEQDTEDDEVALDTMKAMSKEEIEAQRMMAMRATTPAMTEYEEKQVARVVDDNPVFTTSLRMQSPAPDGHFLRIFGQPNRAELGDLRDDSASMRQALMMLNGRVTHEASRVGDLEPMYKLLAGRTVDVEAAVKLAYLEILTRRPSADEMSEAKQLITSAQSPLDGMADLRWILLNCHEFRFLP